MKVFRMSVSKSHSKAPFIVFILFVVFFSGSKKTIFAKDLGTFGMTYAIAEPDALDEIERRAKEVNWGRVINKKTMEKRVKTYRPAGLKKIQRADKDRVFKVNMAYTLQLDIPDGEGGILYPRGYRFNPLEHVFLPNIIVIINGDDPEQVDWFQSSRYADHFKVSLLLTEGDYGALSDHLKRPVYYADRRLLKRFNIQAVPSIAMQKGIVMEVTEIAIPQNK